MAQVSFPKRVLRGLGRYFSLRSGDCNEGRSSDGDFNASNARIQHALSYLATRLTLTPCDDCPVFILSAGWRSGSTLLQRMVQSTGCYHVWGEPYEYAGIIQQLANAAGCFADKDYIDARELPEAQDPFQDRRMASVSPPLNQWFEAQRIFLQRMFTPPPRAGNVQWGLKEVRLDCAHARFLQLLFPRARFLLLVRNPASSWASYRGSAWFYQWPDVIVDTPQAFGRMWSTLAGSFRADAHHLNAVEILQYEQLHETATLARLQNFLGAQVDPRVLQKKFNSREPASATGDELEILHEVTGAEKTKWGY